MDNIDIKEIWKNQPTKDLSDKELDRIRLQKSESFLDRLKKNARIENAANIIISLVFSMYIFFSNGPLLGSVSLIGMTIFSFYFYTLYKEIWKLEPTDDVKGFLRLVLEKMKFFLNRYYVGIVIVMPLAFWFGLNLGSQDENIDLDTFLTVKGIILISVTLIVTVLVTFWVIHLMYGKTVNKLKEMLKALEENQ
jgi:hypothetical protein